MRDRIAQSLLLTGLAFRLLLGSSVPEQRPDLAKLRLLFIIGIAGAWLFFVSLSDVVPELEESTITNGILTRVIEPSPPRAVERVFFVHDSQSEKRFLTYSRAKTAQLREHLGQPIKIWSYRSLGVLANEENIAIEIQIGEELLLNDWEVVKKRNIDSKGVDRLLLAIFIIFVITPIAFLVKQLSSEKYKSQDADA